MAVIAATVGTAAIQSATIDAMAADRLGGRPGAGLLVGTLDGAATNIVRHGQASIDGDTAFNVSALAEVFIGVALADMVAKGELALKDPVGKHLTGVVVPTRGGKSITLEDLAMHRAALPRVLPGLKRADATTFAPYTRERLAAFLAEFELPRDIGERHERSHLGTALLAVAMAERAAMPLERLLQERVFLPLKLSATRMEGGILLSSAQDLLAFLAANLRESGPLAPALADTRASRGNFGAPREGLGLGWRIRAEGTRQVLWASGAAGGQQAFMALQPATGHGAVVLHTDALSADDLGFRALEELRQPSRLVDVTALAAFTGEYEVRRGFVIRIGVDGTRLVARVADEPESPLTQDSELRFVLDYGEARITFIRDAAGHVIGLMLHRGGQHIGARKVR